MIYEVKGARGNGFDASKRRALESANGTYVFSSFGNGYPIFTQTQGGGWRIELKGLMVNSDAPKWALCVSAKLRGILKGPERMFVSKNSSNEDKLPTCGSWHGNWSNHDLAPVTVTMTMSRKRTADTVLQNAWKKRSFADAEIICKDQRFPVHRVIICEQSSVFNAAFSSEMREATTATYEIKGAQPAAVEAMLNHLYGIEISLSDHNLSELMDLAIQYDLPDLASEVAGHMVETVTADNVQERLRTLQLHRAQVGVKSAMDRMIEIIREDKTDSLILGLAK